MQAALVAKGYAEPTPVQEAVITAGAEAQDLLVSAQTGSGKTVAYGLAMAPTLLGDNATLPHTRTPLALVIAPTRELALQVHREFQWLYGPAGARLASCVGGMDIRREQRALAQGAHIVVGTPGRLVDHLNRGNLDASALRVVVLDEADEMLDLGFRDDLEVILDAMPEERRTLLFSATLPKGIVQLAKQYQKDALRISTVSTGGQHADIDYRAVRVAPSDLEHAIVNLLRYFDARGAMVFCATREAVRRLHGNLLEKGFAAVALSGELSQSERNHALQALRDGRARVCIATDVAARGIDLPDLGLVIHAELPTDSATLLHRSGRTGRAGKKGICAVLVPHSRRRRAERLLAEAKLKPQWMNPPSADEIRAMDLERMLAEPTLAEGPGEEEPAAVAALLEKFTAEQITGAFVRLHRERLPEPEELFADGAPEPDDRGERGPRQGFEESMWFRINVGRSGNADPRWLLPFLCRHGHVTRRDIGAIRIFDRDTRFEIAASAATRFMAAVRKAAAEDPDVIIEPAEPATDAPRSRPRLSPRFGDDGGKPRGGPKGFKPRGGPRPQGDRPYQGDRPRGGGEGYIRPAREGYGGKGGKGGGGRGRS